MFAEQIGWAKEANVDFVIAETISWTEEAKLLLKRLNIWINSCCKFSYS